MLKKYSLIILLIFVVATAFTQNMYKYATNDTIKVFKNGEYMTEPWGGGLNNPQFNEIDVNFDCVLDIVIFDRAGNILRVYVNDNIENEVSYHYAPEYAKFFPGTIDQFLLIRDYNNDGKPDLMSYRPGGIRVWKNVSDSTLKFELFTDMLLTKYGSGTSNVFVIPIDYPVIDDINGDGLLDILAVNVSGIFTLLYENISTDPDSFFLETTNTCWGHFYENQLNDSLVLGAQCKGGGSNVGVQRHSGATMLSVDLTGTGAKDILLGDMGYSNLAYLRNGGSPGADNIISVNYHYAGNGSKEIDFPTFPAAFFMDVNNNGRKDLIVSSNQLDGGLDTGNVWFYDNFGANNNPNFEFDRANLLVGNQIDVGTGALPVLVDLTGDSLQDLVIGNVGYFVDFNDNNMETEYESSLAFYKNIGTDSTPIFEFVTNDLQSFSNKDFMRLAPTFGDLDGDGDVDLIFGEMNGSLSYYENIAPAGQMADFQLVADTFMGQFFGVQPSPFLFDVDGDGALDLLVGQKNGITHLYLNQGGPTNPVYTLTATDTLGGIFNYHINSISNNAIPFIGKITSSGNNILVVSDGRGNLLYYDGLDNNYMGNFTLIDSMKVSNSYIGIAGADLTGNDSLELIIGEQPGGLMYLNINEVAYNSSPYPTDTCVISSVWEWNKNSKTEQFAIIPNPNNGNFRVELEMKLNTTAVVSIIDLSGKLIRQSNHQMVTGNNEIKIENAHLKAGIYLVQIRANNEVYRSKLVVQ